MRSRQSIGLLVLGSLGELGGARNCVAFHAQHANNEIRKPRSSQQAERAQSSQRSCFVGGANFSRDFLGLRQASNKEPLLRIPYLASF